MDEENNVEKSDSTEIDEKSDTETECFDKGDSDTFSQSGRSKELKCTQCKISFQLFEELESHKKHHHPMVVYKCIVDGCPRWFSSRRSRDKHSVNTRSRLHKSATIKPPPSNAIFIENASQEELEIMKNYVNVVNRAKGKRGPKPKFLTEDAEKNFLVGLPRDQLKRKLMDSVVEKLELSPHKKSSQGHDSSPPTLTTSSKRRPSVGQLSRSSSVTIPNVSSPKPLISKSVPIKIVDPELRPLPPTTVPKWKPIPNFSQLKVPILPILESDTFSLPKFVDDLITLLTSYDVADYFKYPLIDHYAPGSSQLLDAIDMETIKGRLKLGQYANNISHFKSDLLKLYGNGIHSFNEKSLGWQEAAKLYQTSLVNIQNAEKKMAQIQLSVKDHKTGRCNSDSRQSPLSNDGREVHLKILNPYNDGKVNDHERIMSIGEQTGTLKSANQYLSSYKEDRRNKISILSYLDYGANFSFGPCYDSGNAYCTKEVSDLLIRGYGDQLSLEEEEEQFRELNEIIPEPGLGDDFSLYLMNALTRDVLRGGVVAGGDVMVDEVQEEVEEEEIEVGGKSKVQMMLDGNADDLKQLKYFNYQRLSNLQAQPSTEEWLCASKVTNNLTAMIAEVTPDVVTDRDSVRRALDLVL